MCNLANIKLYITAFFVYLNVKKVYRLNMHNIWHIYWTLFSLLSSNQSFYRASARGALSRSFKPRFLFKLTPMFNVSIRRREEKSTAYSFIRILTKQHRHGKVSLFIFKNYIYKMKEKNKFIVICSSIELNLSKYLLPFPSLS